MLGSYRGIIVAIAGLALSGAQPPQEQAKSSARTEQAKPTTPAYAPYPGYDPDPCYHAKDHDAADLCAQWRAAIAAEKAAHEARRSSNWSIVATLLSALSLGAVAWALRLTVESNRIARSIARNELRAYVTVESVEMISPEAINGPFKIFPIVRNSGQTPAQDLYVWSKWEIVEDPREIDFRLAGEKGAIGPWVLGPGLTKTGDRHDFAMSDYKKIGAKKVRGFFWGKLFYRDIFDDAFRETEFCLEGRVKDSELGFIPYGENNRMIERPRNPKDTPNDGTRH